MHFSDFKYENIQYSGQLSSERALLREFGIEADQWMMSD